jgi:hypothetical protein
VISLEEAGQWVTVARAAREFGITEAAVRKRIRSGALAARGQRGATQVLLTVSNSSEQSRQLVAAQPLIDSRAEVARMTEEVAELRARLAEAQTDRDRWYEAALAAREDARAEARSREAIERELRLALTTRS